MTDRPLDLVRARAEREGPGRPAWRVLEPDMHRILYTDGHRTAPDALRALADALEQYDPGPGLAIEVEDAHVREADDYSVGWNGLAAVVLTPEPDGRAVP